MIRKENRNLKIIEVIEKNPGIKFREIMRSTGMKNGVLSHYLSKIEKNEIVQVKREARETRFYPLKITDQESKVIRALRKNTTRKIIESLLVHNEMQFSEIVNYVKKSPSTVSIYISQLVSDDIIEIRLNERRKTYQIKDRQILNKIIEEYRPDVIDSLASGFEDIVNSL